jgi:hypothetical protein
MSLVFVRRFALAGLILATFVCGWAVAHAAELQNGGFETPVIPPKNYSLLPAAPLSAPNTPGTVWSWQTTDTAIELWSTGFQGVPAYQGNQFAEINAYKAGTLSQVVGGFSPGGIASFTWAHRGRAGVDVASAVVRDLGPDGIAGTADDKVLFTQVVSDGKTAWGVHTGRFQVVTNTVRLEFTAISSAGGNTSYGNFIDGIQLFEEAQPTVQARHTTVVMQHDRALVDSLGFDCQHFGGNNLCLSARASRINATFDSGSGGAVATTRLWDDTRFGMFVETPDVWQAPATVTYSAITPVFGGFIGYGLENGTGPQARVSAATLRSKLVTIREMGMASGKAPLTAFDLAGAVGYGVPLSDAVMVQPFAELQRKTVKRHGYTENQVDLSRTSAFSYPSYSMAETWGRIGAKAMLAWGSVGLGVQGGVAKPIAKRWQSYILSTNDGYTALVDPPVTSSSARGFGGVWAAFVPSKAVEMRIGFDVTPDIERGRYARTGSLRLIVGL